MRQSKYRYLIPNSITFLSLACGILAILMAGIGEIRMAGMLVLASYVLDLLDGELARRLNAGTAFGVQLDSLVDIVSLGTAPAVVMFFHLIDEGGVPLALLVPATVTFVLAGAFRLARFNLLPVKEGQTDSIGLTISTGGATLTLAVLSDMAYSGESMPNIAFVPLLVVLTILMVSRISYPSLVWVFSRRWVNFLYMVYFAITLFLLHLHVFNVWFLFNSGYLSVALMREGYRAVGD